MTHSIKIAYCGPIARPGHPAPGGYEAANRNTISKLREQGIEVREYAYPIVSGNTLTKAIRYGLGLSCLLVKLVSERRRWDILHITGLKKGFLGMEAAYVGLSRLIGKKVIFDMRAGNMITVYEARSTAYRWVFNRVISLCDAIAVEGTQYTAFIENIWSETPLYLPNFVAHPAVDNPRLADPGDTIALVHLGRLIKEKGVETAIHVKRGLEQHNLRAELTIVGTGEPEYLAYLKETYPDEGIFWIGAIAQEQVRETIRGSHFFIFPTEWWGEGHSNALNECMAEGVVPVCSDNGFNRSVVGDAGRILPGDATAETYAREVAKIWKSGEWPDLSKKSTDRVRTWFAADVVVGRLIGLYEALLKS